MEIKDIKWTKWIAIGVGGLLGLSHLGMIGIIANRKPLSKFPQLNIPVSEYTSYEVEAGTDGYRIRYNANDPKSMFTTKVSVTTAQRLCLGRLDNIGSCISFTTTKASWLLPKKKSINKMYFKI